MPQPAAIPDQVETAWKEFQVAERHYRELLRHINGRLSGREWLIADAAWRFYCDARVRLMKAPQKETVVPRVGPLLKAPKPEITPKRITPFALAAVAALLAGNTGNAADKLPMARQLLIDAAGYLEDCQAQVLVTLMDGISFDEILESCDKKASPLSKWLPGITTSKGLEKLIRRYYADQCRPFTAQELAQMEESRGQPFTEEERSRLMHTGANQLQIEQGTYIINEKKLALSELMQIRAWRTEKRRGKPS